MAGDIFVVVQGIEGESQDAVYQGAVEATSWHFFISQPSSMHSGSGGGSGKATLSDLHFVHAIDRSSPNFLRYCLTGKHIPEVRLIERKAGGVPLDYLKLTLNDVIVTHVEQAVSKAMTMEHVSLSFARLKQEYVVQSATGGSQGTVTATVDVKQNRAV